MKFLNQKGELFLIVKELQKYRIDDYKEIQKKYRTDLVIKDKSDTLLYFINHIPNVEIIEETNE